MDLKFNLSDFDVEYEEFERYFFTAPFLAENTNVRVRKNETLSLKAARKNENHENCVLTNQNTAQWFTVFKTQ